VAASRDELRNKDAGKIFLIPCCIFHSQFASANNNHSMKATKTPRIPKSMRPAVSRDISKEYHKHPGWSRKHKIAAGIGTARSDRKKRRR
jgi:hypothetical protein